MIRYVRCVIYFRILRHLTRRAAFPYPDFGAREQKSPLSSILGTCMSSSTGVQMHVSEVVASISCVSDGPEITWSSRQNSGFDVYVDPSCSHPHCSGKAFNTGTQMLARKSIPSPVWKLTVWKVVVTPISDLI